MRAFALTAFAILIASSASAQTGAIDPIDSSTLAPAPFGAQSAVGDGVPVNTQAIVQAAPAIANAGTSAGLGKLFDEADTNKDGVVTRAEFLAKADRHFGMADTNKDGKITREEMNAQQASIMQQMQKNMLGGNWQGKLNDFLGNGAGGAPAPQRLAPIAPHVTQPSAPTAPVVQSPVVIP